LSSHGRRGPGPYAASALDDNDDNDDTGRKLVESRSSGARPICCLGDG
jgi:hypothetical protein